MVLAMLRRVLPAGLLLASLTWLACSPDSDITGPTSVGGPSFAEAVGEPVTWEPEPGVTVTMQFLGDVQDARLAEVCDAAAAAAAEQTERERMTPKVV